MVIDADELGLEALLFAFLATAALAVLVLWLLGWTVGAAWGHWRRRQEPDLRYPFVLLALITTIAVPVWAWGSGWSEPGIAGLALTMLVGWLALAVVVPRRIRRPQPQW